MPLRRLAAWLAAGAPVILARIEATQGSAPREAGAIMAVTRDAFEGTIGGGALEALAIQHARKMLVEDVARAELDQPLGPEIGQCCGGRVQLALWRATDADLHRFAAEEPAPQALIFGAGHVGGALARTLSPLPMDVTVFDSRTEWLTPLEGEVRTVLTALPEAEVSAAPPGAAYIILTHDHATDFLIAEAALARGDAAYVGMIGSASKRAQLASRADISALTCPIGAGVSDKRPEVIAAMTAAEVAAALL